MSSHLEAAFRSSRREFLVGIIAGSVGSGITNELLAVEKPALSTARKQAAWRKRRVIFNNDGDDIWAQGADSVETFLAARHTPLLNTYVDSIYYCTTQSFNHFTHDTKIAEVFESTSGSFLNNNLRKFIERKTDGLRMSSEFARKNGMETIWTLRMNDIHDAWTSQFFSDWKREDSSRIMSSLDKTKSFNDRRRLWSLVDFEHPDVEPRLLGIVAEVLRNYEIDGIELDFLRAPIYFRTAYNGEPVTDKQRGILTRLVEKIRKLVLKESERKGKPLLLNARVPTTIALCEKIGIDLKSWLQDKLLDVLAIGGGYITFDVPITELTELGHKHSVPVYPCISQSGLMQRPPRGTSTNQSTEAWLGAASRLWADGADGIYTFNLFPGPGNDETRKYARNVLTKIGDEKTLHDSSIQYAISDAGWWMPSHYWAKDAADFRTALPIPITPNEFTRTYMVVPEDMRGADINVMAEVRVDFTGISKDTMPVIVYGSANFGPQSNGQDVAGVRRFTCRVPLQAITKGRNRVMVKVPDKDAKLAGVELWVRR